MSTSGAATCVGDVRKNIEFLCFVLDLVSTFGC